LVFVLVGLFALFDFERVDCEPDFARSEVALASFLAVFFADLVRPKPRSSSSAPADWDVDPWAWLFEAANESWSAAASAAFFSRPICSQYVGGGRHLARLER
jgi:hypothetical protein